MEHANLKSGSADALLAEFFAQDDLKALAADAGALLECPLIVLDDTFHVMAHHRPLGFTDPLFQDAVRQGRLPMRPVQLSVKVKRCLPGGKII